jgi:cyanate permease
MFRGYPQASHPAPTRLQYLGRRRLFLLPAKSRRTFAGKLFPGGARMDKDVIKVYGYRWVMLIAFMAVVAVNQLLWITFAPITLLATQYYKVSDLSIGILSMVFMIVFIIFSIPASWAIDKFGVRIAVGAGAALTGIFGLMRGLTASDYTLVLIAQTGIAIGQPLILNAITTIAARWFPVRERATASGLASLAMYLGIFIGMMLTPWLATQNGMAGMLTLYGAASLIATAVFFVFAKERPPTPTSPSRDAEKSLVVNGMSQTFRSADFVLLLIIFFVGLGVFNAVTTWIEDIVRPRGFSVLQAGIAGGVMIAGGIVGALLLPTLSDHLRKRTPFIRLALVCAVAGLAGITFATSYPLLLISSFLLGFFLLSTGPIGFQYGAEVTHPVPEGTSNGLLLLVGQISGIIFIFGMDGMKSPEGGSMTLPLVIMAVLMGVAVLLSVRLKEARFFLAEADRN